MKMKDVAYIIPVYNEGQSIDEFIKVLKRTIHCIKGYNFKIIFVNDGSTDNSLSKLKKAKHKDNRIKIINLSRNFGHQIAITAGLDYIKADAAIIIDADLQDPPEVSIDLLKRWEAGYEVVYAKRRVRKDGFLKQKSAFFFYRILDMLTTINIPNDTGDFRLIDRKVIDSINRFREQNRYMRGLFTYIGFRQVAVEYDRAERFAGNTHYTLSSMFTLAFNGITGFSTAPLRIIAQVGFAVSLFSLVGIIYALILRIFYAKITVPGWTLTIIAILFIGGIQMFTLGVVGIYIGKIYTEVQNRPLYIISSIDEE